MASSNSFSQLVNNLWGVASKPLGYICNLNDNVNLLQKATYKLKAKSEDVLAKVESDERGGGVQRTGQVVCWLDMVQNFAVRVDEILREAGERDRINCLGSCLPLNCWSSYELGKKVDQMLNEVRKLQLEGGEFGDDNVTLQLPAPPVLQMPMDETVGPDISLFNEVWKWVVDEKQVGVIGLYGTGGVGKTFFMRSIEQKLSSAKNGFKVIWVVVSNVVNKEGIQDVIRKRMDIKDERWEGWSEEEKVHHLFQALTRKKFVLLLDDLWARLDLPKIGVPCPGLKNGSKVVLTTRLKHVCYEMGVREPLEVQCLTTGKALELFQEKFGQSLVNFPRQIRELANDIVKECKGLPLALITVGRAMAGKESDGAWRQALKDLKNNPHKLGMVNEVYHLLEFSYNNLNDPTHQACFLYCCLFPEDYPMIPNELIELWIVEGLLGDTDDDVYGMRDTGETILEILKGACLLESEFNDSGHCVKMHDVIRGMAIWIACDHERREKKWIVIENEEGMSAKMISKWREVEKVSLWGKWIRNIDQISLKCSQLKTLFVRETNVGIMPARFFDSMAARLTILDLSDNRNIEVFPKEICNLINLLYLNLSATSISELPEGIKQLTRLRWLLLDYISSPALIQTGAIASLPLNVFSQKKRHPNYIRMGEKMVGNSVYSPLGQANEKETMDELGRMQDLTDLSIDVSKSSPARGIFQSSNLRRCIKIVRITDCEETLTEIIISYSPTASGVFLHLKGLYLLNCPVLREIKITQANCFPSLFQVWVENCGFLDLSWLVHAPKLERLVVMDCDSMEKIIGDGFASGELPTSGLFSCLQDLIIINLPSLTSIYDQTLPFPELNILCIEECPRLRKLPVDSNSAQENLEAVFADGKWLDELEWEDDATRANFASGGPSAIDLFLIK